MVRRLKIGEGVMLGSRGDSRFLDSGGLYRKGAHKSEFKMIYKIKIASA